MKISTHNFGRFSESEALKYLKKSGFKILESNYRNRLGEIDIIAQEKETISFVEVKSSSFDTLSSPKEAVDNRKQLKISRCAVSYLKEKKFLDRSARFDVLSIVFDERKNPQFELIRDAFSLAGNYTY